MGQPQSKPQPDVRKHKKSLKVPADWKNNADFQVVSPVSDISNPSQFRGRNVSNRDTVRRSRTSKVYPKARPPTGLPPPQRFYFHGHDEPEKPPTGFRLFQAKCAKMKKMIADCIFQQPEEQYQVIPEIKQQQRPKIPRTIQEVTAHDRYLQFDPVWKEDKGYIRSTDSNPFLEDAGAKLKGSNLIAESTETSYTAAPVPSVTQTHSSTGISSTRGRQLSLESSAGPPDSTSKGPSVLERIQKFEKNSQTLSQKLRSQSVPNQHKKIQQVMHQKTNDEDIFRRNDQYIFRNTRASSLQRAGRHSINNTKSEVSTGSRRDVAPLRERPATTDDICAIHRSNSGRQRATIVPSFSNDSEDSRRSSIQELMQRQIDAQRLDKYNVPTIDELPLPMKKKQPDVRRVDSHSSKERRNSTSTGTSTEQRPSSLSSVSSSSRVDRLRSQYQREFKRLASQNDKYEVPKSRSMDEDRPLSSIPEIKRSHSVPARVSQDSQQQIYKNKSTRRVSTSNNTGRSTSVPRTSVDGSALLQLTGWKANNNKRKSKEVSALLKMAGWNDQSKKSESTKQTSSKAIVPVKKGTQPALVPSKQQQRTAAPLHKEEQRAVVPYKNEHRDVVTNQKKEAKIVLYEKKDQVAVHKQKERTSRRSSAATNNSPGLPHREHSSTKEQVVVDLTKGNTIAKILQQAYFDEEELNNAQQQRVIKSDFTMAYTLPPQSPYVKPGNSGHELMVLSPDVSTATNGSMPMVSDQATENAEFLFDSVANVVRRMSIQSNGGHVTISTLDSQNRMIDKADGPVFIPAPSSTACIRDSLSCDSRRVHFSNKVEKLSPLAQDVDFPMGIESKLSDLTDNTSVREISGTGTDRDSTSSVSMKIPRIDSIPEEDEDESVMQKEPEHLVTEEEFLKDDEEQEEEITPKSPPMMRWSVRNEDGTMYGVTPLIGGRSSNQQETTNSPYLRFKQAKSMFSAKPAVVPVEPDVKEEPIKKCEGSLVTSRVAAMEGRRARSEGCSTTKVVTNKNVHRDSTGSRVLAPRKGNLVSPALARINSTKRMELTKEKISSNALQTLESVRDKSPQWSIASVVSEEERDDSDDDPFGKILHPTTIDEDSDDELDYTSEEESTLQPSVATLRNRFSIASSVESSSVSTVLQPRRFHESNQENKIPSAIDRMKGLPFKEAAPVKPTGSPMPARSWRVLAASVNAGRSYQ